MRPLKITVFAFLNTAILYGISAEAYSQSPITPEPEIQSAIKDFAYQLPIRDVGVIDEAVLNVRKSAHDDRRVMYEQILYFHGTERKQNRMAGDFGPGVLLDRLQYAPGEALAIVLPLLQKADTYWSKVIESSTLDGIAFSDGNIRPDFTEFEGFILNNGGVEIPGLHTLYRYMFQTSPGESLRAFESLDGRAVGSIPQLELLESRFGQTWSSDRGSDAVPDDQARSALISMSQRQQWWARAFVGATLDKNHRFPADDLIALLQKDPHPLVREFADSAAASRVEVKLK